jgi:hypothetical protein
MRTLAWALAFALAIIGLFAWIAFKPYSLPRPPQPPKPRLPAAVPASMQSGQASVRIAGDANGRLVGAVTL